VKVAMLLLAAGRGARFGGDVPKVYLPLAGRPLLLHAAERLRAVAGPPDGELIVVVDQEARASLLPPLLPALDALGARVVDGGGSRQQSMRLGLAAAGAGCELVLVHDAARPLFPVAAARRCLERAAEVGAALLAVPATDTLKRVGEDGFVRGTIDRSGVWYAQTPQAARRGELLAALARAEASGLEASDDVGLIEAAGGTVAVVPGSTRNLKITRAEDLPLAAALLAAETGGRSAP
jgi:2-C-methyl-D-erythritol 4-phosphate cytidylyltransferase